MKCFAINNDQLTSTMKCSKMNNIQHNPSVSGLSKNAKRILPVVLATICTSWLHAQSDYDPADLNWKIGPTTAKVGSVASQEVDEGYVFLEASEVRKFDELTRNPYSPTQVGVIAPEDLSWFAVYSFHAIGYVKDDEKGSLDSKAILDAFMKGEKISNAERRRRGWPELKLIGWVREPHYNETTHNLEWAMRFSSESETVINYQTRILGRKGIMSVCLVCEPDQLSTVLPKFRSVLNGFEYTGGNRYAEFRSGDRIAEVGLTGLIVGGATAVAVKTGVFKWIWKGILVIAVAIGGMFKKIFGKGDRQQ